jgi:hypothetical protein
VRELPGAARQGVNVLGSVVASKVAKAAALCICPIVGTAVVTTQVPAVRKAIHSATAPKQAKQPKRARLALRKPVQQTAQAVPVCADPIPVVLGTQPIKVSAAEAEPFSISLDEPSVPSKPQLSALSSGPAYAFRPLAGVPEPAAWAQMLGGFAVVGATIRYTRKARPAPTGPRQA